MGFRQLKLALSLFAVTTSWIRDLFTGDRIGAPRRAEQLKWRYYLLLHRQVGQQYRNISVENIFLNPNGILVFAHGTNQKGLIKILVNLYELGSPNHPLFHQPKEIFSLDKQQQWQFLKLNKQDNHYVALWQKNHQETQEIVYPPYIYTREVELEQPLPLLDRPAVNPILSPASKNDWEAFCTFNPAAIYANNQVHLLYRAQGHDYVSQIGYARSSDGLTIDERLDQPAYRPSQAFEGVNQPKGDPNGPFASGGGSGGCEDPRATIIDGRVYMTYVAYNGQDHPRIAMTSIDLQDFLAQKFLWTKPVLISRNGEVNKSACIFPEKINGKYVIMHRVFPNILIDYVDSLNFTGQEFLTGQHKIPPRSREWWDSRKVGAGAPPLKTKEGWLLIYQAVDDKDASQYKIGAMLLDLKDPSKVLYRSAEPILTPQETYENHGFKAGVVYPCGAVIKDQTLFVYYGGADSYVCVATADLDVFLQQLKETGHAKLDSTQLATSGKAKISIRKFLPWHKFKSYAAHKIH
jgi:predicted GH43/DUF377 family glycosyl hydrolase